MSPREAMRYGNICPVCHGKLTKGVEQRVNELADRSAEYRPPGAIGYMHLLPLSEIIAFILKASSPYLPKVWELYNSLVTKFSNEYTVLIDTPEAEISKVAGAKIAEAIIRVRHGKARVIPGYDGVYGQLALFEEKTEEPRTSELPQRVLTDWCT
jgi:PHP family Zn ribbon phosphoesterase